MAVVFIKERSFYSARTLAKKLKVDESTARLCIEVLTTRGVLKLKTSNELSEYDSEYSKDVEGAYQFVYVGLVMFKSIAIVVYPKYFIEGSINIERMRKVFAAIRRYSKSHSHIAALSEEGKRANDRLTLMLALLDHYSEHGLYENQLRILKTNGNGQISWERTIALHQPYLNAKGPVYYEYETIENAEDVSSYITRLHRCVLTQCSRFMKSSGLSEMLSIVDLELSNEELEIFGDKQFINYQLEKERRQQFVTWKQEVIDLLYGYVNEEETVIESDECICLGSSSFHVIWEKACKVAFGDQLEVPLRNLGLRLDEKWSNRGSMTLKEIIPRPKWSSCVTGIEKPSGKVSTLIPDIVFIDSSYNKKPFFCIYDAKYYVPTFGREPFGIPGVESITKQFLYQNAYEEFVRDNKIELVLNVFLVPGDTANSELIGRVRFPGVLSDFEHPLSDYIDLWKLPADTVYDAYLAGERLPQRLGGYLLIDANRL